MSLIKVKCTYCEEILEEESTLRASVCPRCGRPYLLEEAAHFYEHPDFQISAGKLVRYCGTQPEVKLPAFVSSIGENVFENNETLKRIVIPEGVRSIGRKAFAYCDLESVVLPNSLESIGDGAFSGCRCLTDVTIPWHHLCIGEEAFSDCTSLFSVITNPCPELGIEDNVKSFMELDAELMMVFDNPSESDPDPEHITASGVLGEFSDLMTTMDFPTEIGSAINAMVIVSAKIGKGAFAGCTALRHICILISGELGDGAFAGCTGLKSVNIADGGIGDGVFAGCAGLEVANILNAKTFGKGVFAGCSSLKDFSPPIPFGRF